MVTTDSIEAPFDFDKPVVETKWGIENWLPFGNLIALQAQAGTGKSLLEMSWINHILTETPFCGCKVTGGDVLLIDQDMPEIDLKKRLKAYANGIQAERKYNLYIEYKKGLQFNNGSLYETINKYKTVKYVFIDTLHSVMGQLDPNRTKDMSVINELKSQCLNSEKTIVLIHHISEKVNANTIEDLMTADEHKLAMGSSLLNQSFDAYYIIASSTKDGMVEKIYARPVSKHITIPLKPTVLDCVIKVENGIRSEYLEKNGIYHKPIPPEEAEVFETLKTHDAINEGSGLTVQELHAKSGHQMSEFAIRKGLTGLEKIGKISYGKAPHNLFKWYIKQKDNACMVEIITKEK